MPQFGEESLLERLNLRVEQLDYAFVRECEDARVLEKILRVLRSGEEGLYPHLIEYVEEHLAKVSPESRLLLRPQPPTRPQDLPRSELEALEADLATWAADLRREEDDKKSKRKQNEENTEMNEEEEEEEEEEEKGRETPSPPLLTPADLPPLDNIGVSAVPQSKVKKGRKSRDAITKVTGGQRAPGSLISDISDTQECQNSPHDPLKLATGGKRSHGSLIEVIDDSENERSCTVAPRSSGSEVKVTEKAPEPRFVSYVSGGSVIKVTVGQEGQGASSRQVKALLREAERQQEEGDLLSASLTYNKVLSVCPQQADARRALAALLHEDSPSTPAAAATTTPLVQEVE